MIELTIDFNMTDEEGFYVGFTDAVLEAGDYVALSDLEGTKEFGIVRSVDGAREVRVEVVSVGQPLPILRISGNTFTSQLVTQHQQAIQAKLGRPANNTVLLK